MLCTLSLWQIIDAAWAERSEWHVVASSVSQDATELAKSLGSRSLAAKVAIHRSRDHRQALKVASTVSTAAAAEAAAEAAAATPVTSDNAITNGSLVDSAATHQITTQVPTSTNCSLRDLVARSEAAASHAFGAAKETATRGFD